MLGILPTHGSGQSRHKLFAVRNLSLITVSSRFSKHSTQDCG
jgi:hypothetical protein